MTITRLGLRRFLPFMTIAALMTTLPSIGLAAWIADGTPICTAADLQANTQMIPDGESGAIIVWSDNRGGLGDIYAQRVDSTGVIQWTLDGVALCTATGDQGGPHLVTDGAGGAIVTWVDCRAGTTCAVYAQRVNSSGTAWWTADGVLVSPPAGAYSPRITSDGAGGAIIVWEAEGDSIYVQRLDASGTRLWAPTGIALSDSASSPSICSNGSGGAIVSYHREIVAGSDFDVYAQRVDGSGVIQWAAGGVAITTKVGMQGAPMCLADGAGGATVTYIDAESGLPETLDIRSQRVNASGVTQWTANGVYVGGTYYGEEGDYTAAPDDSGGVIVTWTNMIDSILPIYTQRIDALGALRWTGDGRRISTATDLEQRLPEMVPDGSGGVIITWQDRRAGNNNIYAQRYDASGNNLWPPNGVPICTEESGSHTRPVITSDDLAGAIIAWMDNRNSPDPADIYAERIYHTGRRDSQSPCTVDPEVISFGIVSVGGNVDAPFSIWNTGVGTLTGTVSESCPHFSIISGGGAYSLAPGEFKVVTVRYEPAAEGVHMCTIETGDDLCTDVSCQGATPANCAVYPDSLDFGLVFVGGTADKSFTMKNTGGVTVSGTVSEACADFDIVSGGGGYALAAGESLVVTVRYQPTSEGSHQCTIDTGGSFCSDIFVTGSAYVATNPLITSIMDIGNDQGRQVRIAFNRDPRDSVSSPTPILQYEVYRRIDPLPSGVLAIPMDPIFAAEGTQGLNCGAAKTGGASNTALLLEGWDYVGAVPAHVEDEYNYVAPTLADSTVANGIHWSVFFVRAATAVPTTFWDSEPDSGYSLDNLSPCAPAALAAEYNGNAEIFLHWNPNTETDLHHYAVYRGTAPGFVPDETNRLGTTTDTSFVDTGYGYGEEYYYKVSATDFNGNEGPLSLLTPEMITGTPGGRPSYENVLFQNTPNPFLSSTRIAFSMKEAGHVSLRVFDAKGRLVRVIVDEFRQANYYVEGWDGRDKNGRTVAAGTYFYGLEIPGWKASKRMTLAR